MQIFYSTNIYRRFGMMLYIVKTKKCLYHTCYGRALLPAGHGQTLHTPACFLKITCRRLVTANDRHVLTGVFVLIFTQVCNLMKMLVRYVKGRQAISGMFLVTSK